MPSDEDASLCLTFQLQIWPSSQMPFWHLGDSESLDHSATFWHGCQLWGPWPAE